MKLAEIRVGREYPVSFTAVLRACELGAVGTLMTDSEVRELAALICHEDELARVVVVAVGEPYRRRFDGVRVRASAVGAPIEFVVHPQAFEFGLDNDGFRDAEKALRAAYLVAKFSQDGPR